MTSTGGRLTSSLSVDFDRALQLSDGDTELLRGLCRVFADSVPEELARLKECVAQGDCERFRLSIHKIQSSIAYFDGAALLAAVVEVERRANAGDLASATVGLAAVEGDIQELVTAVRTCLGA